ncbi:MAG: HypC/HybG/HupF family hydrogenase formation chaperone [Deltaproteobacteria bacterium]|nr:HypC/HybG/HupF family hydrogenase formation chaperone [Deltaproteobacteria bacterium]
MCLAIPSKIIETYQNDMITVESGGVRKKVSSALIENPEVGEWVIVHAGFAIQKLDEQEARETLKFLRDIAEGSSDAGFETRGDLDET